MLDHTEAVTLAHIKKLMSTLAEVRSHLRVQTIKKLHFEAVNIGPAPAELPQALLLRQEGILLFRLQREDLVSKEEVVSGCHGGALPTPEPPSGRASFLLSFGS